MNLCLFFASSQFRIPLDFPGSSDSKESACNIRDIGPLLGLGRSPGEGNHNPLQYSCLENSTDRRSWGATVHRVTKNQTDGVTFLVAQLVNNLPAMQEILVQSLSWEDPLEKRTSTHSSILAWRITWTVLAMGS